MNILSFISRIATKVLLWDGNYFRQKLLLTSVVYGDKKRVHIGKDVYLQNTVLNTSSGDIFIDDHVFCGHDCMILTGTHDASKINEQRRNDHPTSGNDIHIGRGVWISSRAVILGGVTIAADSVIAAGALVVSDCLIPAVYGGVPARRISDLPSSKSV